MVCPEEGLSAFSGNRLFSRLSNYPQVLIAQRTLFQVRAEYVEALVNTWQNAVLLQGYMLSGALDAPGGMTMEGGNPANSDDRD